jgi:uncharacterized iron-regulated protein
MHLPRKAEPAPAVKLLATLWLCALVPACAVQNARPVQPQQARDWVLGRAFEDYYDTAFLFTDAGSAATREVSMAQLAAALSKYDVVFYGESHGHPGVHLQEMKLLRALYARDPRWVVSFEQFERDVQGVVDDYLAGRSGETALIDKGRAWNNYAASYRPLLVFAKEHHLPVIAAEAPDWTINCIGQSGSRILDQFSPQERSWVAADIHDGPGAYRDEYMQFLGGSTTHGGGKADGPEAAQRAAREAQNSFAAQVARDDTMAESIQRALEQHPGYKVLHLTGSFHAAKFLGTVERLKLREPGLRIAVIDPIEVEDPKVPTLPAADIGDGTVLQLIYPNPEEFVEGENMSAWIAKMHATRAANTCKYTLPATAR